MIKQTFGDMKDHEMHQEMKILVCRHESKIHILTHWVQLTCRCKLSAFINDKLCYKEINNVPLSPARQAVFDLDPVFSSEMEMCQ